MAPYSKTHRLFRLSSAISLIAISMAFAGSLQAALVYSELFPNADSTDDEVSTAGWISYSGATATPFPGTGNNKIYIPGGFGNGNPQTRGFLALNALPTGNYITYESGLNIDPTAGALNISWQHHASVAGNAETRLLLQVGGQWVATTQTFTAVSTGTLATFGDIANAGAYARSFTFNPTASSWLDVTLTETQLSINGTARTTDLPSGPITAVGFHYVASGTVSTRIDTLEINQVPEPHLTALALVGGLGLVARRRR